MNEWSLKEDDGSNDEVDLRDGLDFEGADAPVYDSELQMKNQVEEAQIYLHLGVSKNRGTPKWMVYNGKPYQNGWFGGTTIFGNTHLMLMSDGSVFFFSKFISMEIPGVFVHKWEHWICQLSDRCALGRNMWMIQWTTQMAAVVGGSVAGAGWCSQAFGR